MKIATVGFYWDFTRFFAAFHRMQVGRGDSIDVTNFACNLSGRLFGATNGMRNVFLPIAVRTMWQKNNSLPQVPTNVGQYLKKSGVKPKTADRLSQLYTSYFLWQFSKEKPDLVIISGDTRMQSRSAAYACKKLGVNCKFFEQGPFGTTIIDDKGVNSTASFAGTFEFSDKKESDISLEAKREKVQVRKFARFMDYLSQPLFLLLGFQEIREEKKFLNQIYRQVSIKTKTVKNTIAEQSGNFVLVIGQVPTDANFSLFSPYTTSLEYLQDVLALFPNQRIVFREHPLFIGSYERELYQLASDQKQIEISRNQELDSDISKAKYITVVNSTTGMEVVLKHRKPVMCLGSASYRHLHGVYGREEIGSFLTNTADISQTQHEQNMRWFNSSFIEGHFRDEDLSSLTSKIVRLVT